MNAYQVPSVELIQGPSAAEAAGPVRWRRWKVFLGVLLLGCVVGLAIVYGREPLYRASASVLTVKPKAVDARSEEADTEHVAIQGRLLLGEELLGRLGEALSAAGRRDFTEVNILRSMLSAIPIPETNLLELRAEGGDPQLLQRMVNAWAETYETFRAEEIEAATGRTTAELEEEQASLQSKIDTARNELTAFREANDIVSLERGENRNLSRLTGLNDSLNKAQERLAEARAKFAAIQNAIAKGETVVPPEHKSELTKKQLDVERLRDHIQSLGQKFTQRYIDRDPALKALPGVLRELERDLERAVRIGQRTMIDEAQQDIETARGAVESLEMQLAEHQGKVQVFTDRFKEFKSLEEGLKRLEMLYGDIEERLAKIQVRNFKKYPPIQVVDWATIPTRPIYPNYERDLLIALAAALALALFATWLLEYLTGRSGMQHAPYTGMRIYTPAHGPQLSGGGAVDALNHAPATPASLPHQSTPAAVRPVDSAPPPNLPIMPRELSLPEVQALLNISDRLTGGYCALLLSGVSPVELPLMHAPCIDREAGVVSVPGAFPRDLEVGPGAWERLDAFIARLAQGSISLPTEELDANMAVAAADAGIANPITVNAAALWHTYVLFLVRQGARLSDLPQRVGNLAPDVQLALAYFSPPGENRPLAGINYVYPTLVA